VNCERGAHISLSHFGESRKRFRIGCHFSTFGNRPKFLSNVSNNTHGVRYCHTEQSERNYDHTYLYATSRLWFTAALWITRGRTVAVRLWITRARSRSAAARQLAIDLFLDLAWDGFDIVKLVHCDHSRRVRNEIGDVAMDDLAHPEV
jgi:hypothetical protein